MTRVSRAKTSKPRKNTPFLNQAQQILLNRYNGGAYTYLTLAKNWSQFELELQKCYDPVLTALVGLLSDQQGCVDLNAAKLKVTPLLNSFVAINTDLYQDPCRP